MFWLVELLLTPSKTIFNQQPAHSIREATGGGIFATIDRRRVVVGSPEFLRNNHIKNLPEDIHEQTAVLVAAGGKYIGAIYFTNSVRPGRP